MELGTCPPGISPVSPVARPVPRLISSRTMPRHKIHPKTCGPPLGQRCAAGKGASPGQNHSPGQGQRQRCAPPVRDVPSTTGRVECGAAPGRARAAPSQAEPSRSVPSRGVRCRMGGASGLRRPCAPPTAAFRGRPPEQGAGGDDGSAAAAADAPRPPARRQWRRTLRAARSAAASCGTTAMPRKVSGSRWGGKPLPARSRLGTPRARPRVPVPGFCPRSLRPSLAAFPAPWPRWQGCCWRRGRAPLPAGPSRAAPWWPGPGAAWGSRGSVRAAPCGGPAPVTQQRRCRWVSPARAGADLTGLRDSRTAQLG